MQLEDTQGARLFTVRKDRKQNPRQRRCGRFQWKNAQRTNRRLICGLKLFRLSFLIDIEMCRTLDAFILSSVLLIWFQLSTVDVQCSLHFNRHHLSFSCVNRVDLFPLFSHPLSL